MEFLLILGGEACVALELAAARGRVHDLRARSEERGSIWAPAAKSKFWNLLNGSEVPFGRMVGRIVLHGPRYLFLGWSAELCYTGPRYLFLGWSAELCYTGPRYLLVGWSAELCYTGPRYLLVGWSAELCYTGPRYLFLGWSAELCYTGPRPFFGMG
jgi:hypothetical protein